MPHEIKYKIHTSTVDMIEQEVTARGKQMTALVPCLVIEGCDGDPDDDTILQSHTFRLFPDDLEKAQKEFAQGNTLTVTLSGGKK